MLEGRVGAIGSFACSPVKSSDDTIHKSVSYYLTICDLANLSRYALLVDLLDGKQETNRTSQSWEHQHDYDKKRSTPFSPW